MNNSYTDHRYGQSLDQSSNLPEAEPRIFTADDVALIQVYFRGIHDISIADDVDYVPSLQGFYEFLTEPHHKSEEAEPLASEDCFDGAVYSLMLAWAVRVGLSTQGAPHKLSELRELFANNEALNERSPISFQGGAENVTGRFVHVITGRCMGKYREKTYARRYYLNPRADYMRRVVEILASRALADNVPLYFKFINIATGKPDRRTMKRMDRTVIYASDSQIGYIEGLLGKLISECPSAFEGRESTVFGGVIHDGICGADDVTEKQQNRFKGYGEGVSFSELRAKMMYEVTQQVIRDIITDPIAREVVISGETIIDMFVDKLKKEIAAAKIPDSQNVSKDDPDILKALSVGLSSDRLSEVGFSDKAIRCIETAISKLARDILAEIGPEYLLHGYLTHIRYLAPKYGINPDDLSKNGPMTE